MSERCERTLESLDQFQTALRHAPVVLFAQDRELRYTWVHNPAFSAVENILGRTDADLLPPTSAAVLTELKTGVLETGAGVRQEVCLETPVGVKHYDLTVEPIRDADGRVTGVAGTALDITERVSAEAARRAGEERLRQALTAAQAGAWEYNLTTHTARWSPEMFALYELESNASAPSLSEFAYRIHPDDRDRAISEMTAAAKEKGPFAVEFRIIRSDRSECWVMSSGVVRDDLARGIDQDITLRKQAAYQLRKSAHRLRLAMDASAIGMWDWDLATDAVTWCAECYRIFGLPDGTFGGTAAAFDRLIHPDDRQRVWAAVRLATERNSRYEAEFRIVRPDGAVRWVNNLGRALYDDRGQPLQMIGTISDITDRCEAETQRRRNEERLAATQASAPIGIVESDIEGHYLNVNEAFCRLTGYSKAELLARNLLDITHPEDRSQNQAMFQRLAAGEIQSYQMEKRFIRKDGSIVWVDVRRTLLRDANRQPQCVLGAIMDITDRKRADAILRRNAETFAALVEQSPLGIYTVDSLFRIRNVSAGAMPAFCNVRPLIGRDFAEAMRIVWGEPFASEAIAIFRHTLTTGEPYVSPGLTERRRDIGEIESYEWQINRVLLDDGELGVVCYFFDSTRLEQARQALHEADSRKNEFLATLAHELRNPLAPIRNAVQILMVIGSPDPDAAWAREVIERQVSVMARLLGDLLDVSRISRDKLELRPERVDLASVVSAAVETSRPLIDASSHELTVDLPTDRVELHADPLRLAQIFANLLNNAAKYTDQGGHIRVTAERTDGEVVVAVADDGIGIAADMLPRLFEIFAQAEPALERSQGGLGIGLSLVHGLVELHGGTIAAHSDGPGQGSTFTVRLPVAG